MEVEGKNFLIPVDFDSGSDKVDVEVEAMEMDRVQAQLKGFRVQTRLLVVDAYRNGPVEQGARSEGFGRRLGFFGDTGGPGSDRVHDRRKGEKAYEPEDGDLGLYMMYLLTEVRWEKSGWS